jgi:hypothetical protein
MKGNLRPRVIGNIYIYIHIKIYDDFKQISKFKQHIPHKVSH